MGLAEEEALAGCPCSALTFRQPPLSGPDRVAGTHVFSFFWKSRLSAPRAPHMPVCCRSRSPLLCPPGGRGDSAVGGVPSTICVPVPASGLGALDVLPDANLPSAVTHDSSCPASMTSLGGIGESGPWEHVTDEVF